ncbi:hypothetical protein [Streptococcus himalayensis]|uniref:Uncharacterized protein n=1 Tax=Streptococcus himalayensis TaxID=1888195 RepID=A0A917EEV5_9STRE|nr:hypothetical protein [Streptococcus himalayensis]GGE31894.1 hypothetical protein GCM10011510_11480 [Streptococcus himalayensis]
MTLLQFLKQRFHYLIYLGFFLWIGGFFFEPTHLIPHYQGAFRWGGFLVFQLLPAMGLISLILSILFRKWGYAILSLCLIFAFPITLLLCGGGL